MKTNSNPLKPNQEVVGARREALTLIVLSVAVLGFVALALLGGAEAFRPYFGSLHPLLAALLVLALGAASLRYLSQNTPLRIRRVDPSWRGLIQATLLATGLGGVIITADLFVGFPADLNVRWPQSAPFYPAMAYVAEAVFHLAPLALLCAGVRAVRRSRADLHAVPLGVLAVTVLLEPTFQVLPSIAGVQPVTTTAVVFLQVLVFNAIALWLFMRFDFLTTYVFRVVYYLYWHILWGHFRLDVLF